MATEDKIQAAIVQLLQNRGLYFCSIPNEGSQDRIRTMRLMGMGLRPGASDLILILPCGETIWMEVKAPDGKQSESQIKFQKRIEALGHRYILVRSVEDAVHSLK